MPAGSSLSVASRWATRSRTRSADGNYDNVVDATDYAIWKDHFVTAASMGTLATASVPKPAGLLLIGFGTMAMLASNRRNRGVSNRQL